MTCPVCLQEGAPNRRVLCPECRATFGVPERWPESRRLLRPCTRCGGAQLIRAIARERGAGDWYSPRLAPLGVSFRRQVTVSAAGDKRPHPDLHEPIGLLELYVCRACGFTELYTVEPEHVPIGPDYATELLDVGTRR